MSVVGQICYILSDSGNCVEINSFSPDYKTKKIPIVDAAVKYDFPHSMMIYILVILNAFHVTYMTNNLIPSLYDARGGDNGVRQTQNPSGEPHGRG